MAPTNPDTDSEIEFEENGDYTVTFPMRIPLDDSTDTDEK